MKEKKEQEQNPNDQRSDIKNTNNPTFEADIKNRVEQGHITPQEASKIKEGKKQTKAFIIRA